MSRVLCTILFLFMLLSNYTAKAFKNSCNPNNEIVFIFKKNDMVSASKYRTSDGRANPIYITEKGDFKRSELIIDNKLKADTIIQIVKGDIICLTYLYDGFKSYSYQFQKGDTVVFDYEKGVPQATVFGRETKKFDCNFEAAFQIKKPLEDFDFYDQYKRNRNELERKTYKTELHDYRLKIDNTLDSLFAKDLISKNVRELHKGRNKYYEINLNKELLATISDDDLKRDDLLYLKTYQFFLGNFIKKSLKETSTTLQPENPKIVFDHVLKSDVYSARIKDYLLYTNLCRIMESLSNKEAEMYFEKFKKVAENKELCDDISDKYVLNFSDLKEEKKIVYFINNNKQKVTMEEIFSKYKNKVIYVDFWASWCSPCRAAMPSLNNLKKEYKDKEVVFINISIDKDLSAWKMASDKEKLSLSNTNLFAVNYPNALFYETLQLKTIPRYLLYNKKGELVNSKSPHPDSEEIKKELDELLKQ